MARTKVQAFEYVEIERTDIKEAPYNPRVMSENARKKLRAVLGRHGLVETLVWNRRTGHLIGGHRRLEELDAAEGTSSYRLGVAAIDVDERQERELNVALNNPQAQGAFDPTKFFAIVDAGEATLDGMGFSKADLEVEFGSIAKIGEPFKEAAAAADVIVQDIQEIRAARKAHIAAMEAHPKNDAEYFLMVQFRDAGERDAMLARLGIDAPGGVLNADDIKWRPDVQEKYSAARNQ